MHAGKVSLRDFVFAKEVRLGTYRCGDDADARSCRSSRVVDVALLAGILKSRKVNCNSTQKKTLFFIFQK